MSHEPTGLLLFGQVLQTPLCPVSAPWPREVVRNNCLCNGLTHFILTFFRVKVCSFNFVCQKAKLNQYTRNICISQNQKSCLLYRSVFSFQVSYKTLLNSIGSLNTLFQISFLHQYQTNHRLWIIGIKSIVILFVVFLQKNNRVFLLCNSKVSIIFMKTQQIASVLGLALNSSGLFGSGMRYCF